METARREIFVSDYDCDTAWNEIPREFGQAKSSVIISVVGIGCDEPAIDGDLRPQPKHSARATHIIWKTIFHKGQGHV